MKDLRKNGQWYEEKKEKMEELERKKGDVEEVETGARNKKSRKKSLLIEQEKNGSNRDYNERSQQTNSRQDCVITVETNNTLYRNPNHKNGCDNVLNVYHTKILQ